MDQQPVRQVFGQIAARELVASGHSSFLADLQEQVPPGLVEMLRIPGLGVAKVRRIHEALHVDPHRLDLDWRAVRRARDLGVTVSIGVDAHSLAGMANVPVGMGVARKGWLAARDILNTRDAEGFLAYARQRRSA